MNTSLQIPTPKSLQNRGKTRVESEGTNMATVETQKFVRKSFPVEAVQVTPENMKAVAQWCAGKIQHDGEKEGHLSRDYIKVRVAYPINERQTQAFLGDWVLKSGKSFKVYTNSAFEKSFDKQTADA